MDETTRAAVMRYGEPLIDKAEQQRRDLISQARRLVAGTTILLPTKAHLVALADDRERWIVVARTLLDLMIEPVEGVHANDDMRTAYMARIEEKLRAEQRAADAAKNSKGSTYESV